MDDPKIAMMSDSDQLLWVKALCLASESSKRGLIGLTDEEIAWKLRITVETWRHAVDKFRAKGMLEHCKGGYLICNWGKRQFESDDVTKRTAKSKAKPRQDKTLSVGERSQEQLETVPQNNLGTSSEQIQIQITDPESESDLDLVSDSINIEREREKRKISPSLSESKSRDQDNAFTLVEQSPWMKAGDLNSIDLGFVRFVQESLKGRGPYEKKDPSEAEAKTHIRRYMAKPRGSDSRMVLHAAIADKWQAYKNPAKNILELDGDLYSQLHRMGWTTELPAEWSEQTGCNYSSQLSPEAKVEYLEWLRAQQGEYVAA